LDGAVEIYVAAARVGAFCVQIARIGSVWTHADPGVWPSRPPRLGLVSEALIAPGEALTLYVPSKDPSKKLTQRWLALRLRD